MPKRPAFSNLVKNIREGKFVFTGELEPEKDFDLTHVLHSAEEMKKTGKIIAANVTDGPQGDAYTCSMVSDSGKGRIRSNLADDCTR